MGAAVGPPATCADHRRSGEAVAVAAHVAQPDVVLRADHQRGGDGRGGKMREAPSLNLYGCKLITDAAVKAVAKKCPQLTSLDLSGCGITNAAVKAGGGMPAAHVAQPDDAGGSPTRR